MPYIAYLPYIPNIPYFPNMPYQTDHTHHTQRAIPHPHHTTGGEGNSTTLPPQHSGGRGTVPHPHHTTGGRGTVPQHHRGEGQDLRWEQYMGPSHGGGGGAAGPGAYIRVYIYIIIYIYIFNYIYIYTYMLLVEFINQNTCPRGTTVYFCFVGCHHCGIVR